MSTPVPPPPPAGATITHPGKVYGLGYDDTSFGIWPLAGGPVIERFERSEEGWRRAWARFQQLDRRDAVPPWRRRTAAWILLNIVIGLAVWFAILVVDAMAIAIADLETEEISGLAGAGMGIAIPMTLAGWLLFAYAGDYRRRRLAFVLLVCGALVLAVVTGLVGQPEA